MAMDYYAFGGTMSSYVNGSTVDKYKFTGKERDSETGLDYFGARYYDSKICRWMSVDPLADIYPGLSPYNYCMNNPLMLIDPTGMNPEEDKNKKKQKSKTDNDRARTAYGETSSIRPQQKKDKDGKIVDDPESAKKLHEARVKIADVSERNGDVYRNSPGDTKEEQKVWNDCEQAGKEAGEMNLPSDVRNYFLIQEGVGPQRPPWDMNKVTVYEKIGPFIKVGKAGDVPKGNKTYVIFYRDKK